MVAIRRAVAGAVLAAAVLVAMPQSGAAPGSSPQKLASGFRVAAGTHLLGGVVPTIVAVNQPPRGWSAMLWVDSDAISAVNRYARQAARLGFRGQPAQCATQPVPSITSSASPENPQGFVCEGTWNSPDARLHIVVTVCSACEHATSTVVLDYVDDTSGSDAPAVAMTTGPTAKLSSRQQARARRETPTVGEPFTDQLSSDEFPSVVRNSSAAAPSFSLGHCTTGDAEAVLTVQPGKVKSVLASLLRQNTSGDIAGDPLRAPVTTTVNGATLTLASYGYYTSILVVQDPTRATPFLTIEWCND